MKEKCNNCERTSEVVDMGNCPFCASPQPEDMPQNNEKTNISQERLVGSDISEEWAKLIRSAVETKSAIFHMYENGDGKAEMESLIAMLQSFVGDEIRKAEERGKLKGYPTLVNSEALRKLETGVYNQAITDALKALPDEEDIVQNGNVRSWNYAISESRASLEALKK